MRSPWPSPPAGGRSPHRRSLVVRVARRRQVPRLAAAAADRRVVAVLTVRRVDARRDHLVEVPLGVAAGAFRCDGEGRSVHWYAPWVGDPGPCAARSGVGVACCRGLGSRPPCGLEMWPGGPPGEVAVCTGPRRGHPAGGEVTGEGCEDRGSRCCPHPRSSPAPPSAAAVVCGARGGAIMRRRLRRRWPRGASGAPSRR